MLFKYFLQIDKVETMIWIIFHVDPVHIFLVLCFLLLFIFAVFCFKFQQIVQSTTVALLSSTVNDDRLKHYKNTHMNFKKPIRTLFQILIKRSSNVFVHSLIIAIPIVVFTVFILNYSIIYMDMLNQKSEYDLVIKKYPDVYSNDSTNLKSEFSEEEIDYVKSIPEISNLELRFDIMEGDYVIEVSDKSTGDIQYPYISIDGRKYLLAKMCPYSDLPQEHLETITSNEDEMDNNVHVAISKNHAFAKYSIGDKIYLYIRNNAVDNYNHIHEDVDEVEDVHNSLFEPIELTVTNLLEIPYSEEAVAIYFNDDVFKEITNVSDANIMQIKLNDNVDDIYFTQKISAFFNDPQLYEIANISEKVRIKSRTSIGVFILMEAILGMISIFMLITLLMLLSEYIRRQKNNIKMLFVLGASKHAIIRIYMYQASVVAIMCLIVSFGIGMLLSAAFFSGTGYKLIVTPFVLISYILTISIVMLAFMLPVFLGLKKQLQKL